MESVAIGGDGIAAGKDDVVYIPTLLVRFLGTKDPLVTAFEANFWPL
jgi:hypothetical protein